MCGLTTVLELFVTINKKQEAQDQPPGFHSVSTLACAEFITGTLGYELRMMQFPLRICGSLISFRYRLQATSYAFPIPPTIHPC